MNDRKSFWVFGTLVGAIVLLTQFCSPPQTTDTTPYLNHNDSVGYVGMAKCATCHLDKVETFVHTGMGMSFDTVSFSKSSANFGTNHVLYDSFNNFYYFPYWKNEKLFVMEFRLIEGDTVYKRIEEITYIIGSGQHTNSHLIQKGDYIIQAPFTWYAQDQKLDFPPGFEAGANSRFSRVIDQECMSCHNGIPSMKHGSSKAFEYVPNGIDCERCHGPGQLHVSNSLAGVIPEGDIDYSIVNPSKLSWERQIDVCQRCHLQGNNVLKASKTFNDFKPGMVLSEVFEIYLPQYEGDNQLFNMANHADRFQHSVCFLESNKQGRSFTCITCHNPHVSVTQTDAVQFNAKCLSCHTDNSCKEKQNVRELKDNNCVNCHMPKSSTEDIPHVTVHDHKIAIHNTSLENKSDKVVGLYSVNNPSPEINTMIRAYLTYYEKFDALPIYQQKAKSLLKKSDDLALWIHYHYQKQDWDAIVELVEKKELPDSKNAITCYRVGKAFSGVTRHILSAEWLQLAVLKEPSSYAYKSDLAAEFIKTNDFDKAEVVLIEAINQYDNYVPSYNNLGYLYVRMGKYSLAKKYLERSLTLDPDNLIGKENLVLLYAQLNDTSNELKWLKAILKQDPFHNVALNRYSQLVE